MLRTDKSVPDRLRVLVADDDPVARNLVTTHLDDLDCEFVEAEDGLTAWHAVMSNSFDLAIVDLGMPNLDGLDLIRCVRAHPRTKHMPLVVITAREDKQAITDSLAAGATSFMTKPINWTTLTPHIGYLLKLSHEASVARHEATRFKATCRVKDAILGNVLGETFANACDILEDVREILQESELSFDTASASEALDRIALHTIELQSLVSKASKVAKAVTDAVSVDEKIVFVSDMMNELRSIVETTAAARDITLEFPNDTAAFVVRCDQAAFTEAMVQLVLNAIMYSPRGSEVSVGCQLLPDGVLAFEIVDEGCGMSPAFLAKTLAPLAFSDAMPALGRGDFGLGLPLAKAIAEAHDGTLELRSMPEQGTTATIFLPAERVIVSKSHAAA